jgi:hypothetical protein
MVEDLLPKLFCFQKLDIDQFWDTNERLFAVDNSWRVLIDTLQQKYKQGAMRL